jgi:hypothetical protein
VLFDDPAAATDTGSSAEVQIAGTFEARSSAFELVYRKYTETGLIQPNRFNLRVTPYHLLPTTSIFVAVERDRVICTVSLIGDGVLGLPMEGVYASEIRDRRQQRMHIGEVSCLAFEPMVLRNFLMVFMNLTRLMAQHARASGMHQFLIAVHPQHARFYERFMGFERVGPLRSYPPAQDAPAVAMCLDFAAIDQNRTLRWKSYFGSRLPPDELRPRPMSSEERAFFGPISQFGDCPILDLRAA